MPRAAATPPKPRTRRGTAEGRALVSAWRGSGLTINEFARRRGVSAQRISYWRLRLANDKPASGFVEVRASAPVASPVEVLIPGGVVVRVCAGFNPAVLSAVVTALAASGRC